MERVRLGGGKGVFAPQKKTTDMMSSGSQETQCYVGVPRSFQVDQHEESPGSVRTPTKEDTDSDENGHLPDECGQHYDQSVKVSPFARIAVRFPSNSCPLCVGLRSDSSIESWPDNWRLADCRRVADAHSARRGASFACWQVGIIEWGGFECLS